MRICFQRLLVLASAFFAVSARAEFESFIRPDFQNLTGPGLVFGRDPNPGLIPIQGLIKPVASAPTDGSVSLTEASFGQPFSAYLFQNEGGETGTYAAQVVAQVRSVLYPPHGSTRAEVQSSGTAFRYKWLLFSPSDGETDVTSHFENMDAWFGDPERALADEQILVLRDALAVSPLDTGLRDQLLECYYDLAIAEMQFAKKRLASLAAKHLGFELTSPFIIDEEIAIYESLVELEKGVLEKYAELLSTPIEGVDPNDFDSRERVGTPMGLYTFVHQQPYRNIIASEYATDTGYELIPDYDPETHSVIPRADNLVLFAGYKDYITLLDVMGQYIQHNAELARLRGMRQAPNDLTKARNAISQIQEATATDFMLLQCLFEFTPENEPEGVAASVAGVQSALADLTNVRSFINGTANVLGLDPNFLLLVQGANLAGGYNNESFDILYDLLKGLLKGDNQPLGDALAKLDTARTEYDNFQASVDQVLGELADIDISYRERYVQITGYQIDEVPGFQGMPKANSGCELELVEQSMASLNTRNATLRTLSHEITESVARAREGLSLAEGLDRKVDEAQNQYINTTSPIYTDLIIASSVSAAADAAYNTIADAAAAATEGFGASSAVIAVAGAANTIAQTATTVIIGERERDLDYAAIAYSSFQQKVDNALTVNQARQELGVALREQHSNTLETTDNLLALSQAQAQRSALFAELRRLEATRKRLDLGVRTSYYANPIHYIRAENALILADAAFRNAQRWIFYTQRALEYKWQQRFTRAEVSGQGIRTFDSGTVFKLRNASELNDLLTQLKAWNDDRVLEDSGSRRTSFISMRDDVIAPNPNRLNLTLSLRTDPGVRVDLETQQVLPTVEFFQRELGRSLDGSGNLVIDFDTTQLDTRQADFFIGPNYSTSPMSPGEWRDKIVYLKVNIVATDGTTIPANYSGSLTYGGQTFFRTRIPPCPDRSVNLPAGEVQDIPGEFLTAPFRFFSSANYDNVFVSQDTQTSPITAAYTGATAKSPTGEEILGETYQVNAFNQRSVAATRWRLILIAPPGGWDLSKITDIELIVRHNSSIRLAPICN